MITRACNRDTVLISAPSTARGRALSVPGINTILSAPFQNLMGGDQSALVQNSDQVRQLMHLDNAPSAVGNAIVIAADRDETVMADTAFQLQQRIEWRCRQALKIELLGRQRLGDDPLCRGVQPDVGYRDEPILQLGVQIVEV